MQRSVLSLPVAALLCSLSASSFAALTGLWNFDGNLNADVGSNATYFGTAAAKTTFDTASNFGIAPLSGGSATVMRYTPYTAAEGLAIPAAMAANGGGSRVNQYTIVMDYMPTSYEGGYLSLFEANVNNNDSDAEVFIKETSHDIGCGYSFGGYKSSPITDNAWHRIAIVVDVANTRAEIFVNGATLGSFNGGNLGTVDGNCSVSAGAGSSFLLFTSPATGYNGSGYINSLAIYDRALNATQIAALGGPTAAGLPATEPALAANLKHESLFNQATGTSPVAAHDATAIHATDGDWTPGGSGWYTYPGDGTLKFWHPSHEWDDSMFEFNSAAVGTDILTTSPIEYEFDFDTNYLTTAGTNATVEILMTNPGQNYADARTNANAILWFQADMSYGGVLSAGFGPGNADPALALIGVAAADMTDAKVIINHDPGLGQWRAFYSINGGSRIEVAGSPLTAARTTTAIRVEADNTPWAGTMDSWELIAKNLKIYNAIVTTTESLLDGELLRSSNFNLAAGSVAGDFYSPINSKNVNALFVPSPATHEFSGTVWQVTHPGTNGLFPNASISTMTTAAESFEIVLDLKPAFTNDGVGQMFNVKFDGADVAFYLGNFAGASQGTKLVFGEAADIYNPSAQHIHTLPVSGAALTDLQLILNYDSTTQEYNAFYRVNGGALYKHQGSPVVKARTSTATEFQWQAWNTSGTTAFSVGIDKYQELWGVVTPDTTTTSVQDFMLFD